MTAAAPDSEHIRWQWSSFSELSPRDLYAVVRLREAVFVVEQNCPYLDADGRDPNAWHLLGWSIAGERRLLAYTRVFEPGVRYPERAVDAVLRAWYDDYVTLRRYLIDEDLMARENGLYWRTGGYVDVS